MTLAALHDRGLAPRRARSTVLAPDGLHSRGNREDDNKAKATSFMMRFVSRDDT
jgi:hypothetical protein